MLFLNGHKIDPTIFPDGTSQVWNFEKAIGSIYESEIVWMFEHEGEFMHLAQLKHFLDCWSDGLGPYHTLILPYLPYARQDKQVSISKTFALRTLCRMLSVMKWSKVQIFDPHSDIALHNIKNSTKLIPQFSWVDHDVIIFPDKGAKERYDYLDDGTRTILIANKVRDQQTGRITHFTLGGGYEAIRGKRVIVIDDLCDGGATFTILGRALVTAAQTTLYVSHGVFSKGLEHLYSLYDMIITTNSFHGVYNLPQKYIDLGKLQILDYTFDTKEEYGALYQPTTVN